jgi:5-methylthioribose kinase
MIELTADNVLEYLRRLGWISSAPAQAESLSGGVSNQVLRITTPERRFVLKQSRPQLRTREDWFSDLDRIWREQEVMQALHPYLPEVVPEVLHVDRDNYVYAMSHAPIEATVWKAELLADKIDLELAARVGDVLGRMHRVSIDDVRFRAFRDRRVFVQLRIDPFYCKVQERRPEVAPAISALIERMLTVDEALCHGDYTPKNMLIHAPGFTLVDYETAHFGDPTMDLGLFMAHLVLKALRAPAQARRFFALMAAFWRGYVPHVEDRASAYEPLAIRHCGACLLARVDGTSPVDYLQNIENRELIRHLARAFLIGNIVAWHEARLWCARAIGLKQTLGDEDV